MDNARLSQVAPSVIHGWRVVFQDFGDDLPRLLIHPFRLPPRIHSIDSRAAPEKLAASGVNHIDPDGVVANFGNRIGRQVTPVPSNAPVVAVRAIPPAGTRP